MQYFRLSTHFRSNTQITDDHDLVLEVAREMLSRNKQLIIFPDPMTDDEYSQLAKEGEEIFDPKVIADWISIIPEG